MKSAAAFVSAVLLLIGFLCGMMFGQARHSRYSVTHFQSTISAGVTLDCYLKIDHWTGQTWFNAGAPIPKDWKLVP